MNALIYKLDAENALSGSCGMGVNAYKVIHNIEPVDPETLPIVKELRSEVERLNKGIENLSKNVENAYKQRDKAVNDLRVCAMESYTECEYCLHRSKETTCWNCTNGSNWEWRGVRGDK